MDTHRRRLKALELTLTPFQIVLLWLRTAVKVTFEDNARQFPSPRAAMANSISRTIKTSLKGQPESVIEHAILQGHQEADMLYNLIINVNVAVQESLLQRDREYLFLLGYLTGFTATADSIGILQDLILIFVEEVLLLDEAISHLSAERFGSQSLLFADSVLKLKEQMEMAEKALWCLNVDAQARNLTEMTAESVREKLRPDVEECVARWLARARIGMLAAFGERGAMLAALNQQLAFIRASVVDEN